MTVVEFTPKYYTEGRKLAFYFRSFTLTDQSNDGYGAAATAGTAGKYTKQAGYLAYHEVRKHNFNSRSIFHAAFCITLLCCGRRNHGMMYLDCV